MKSYTLKIGYHCSASLAVVDVTKLKQQGGEHFFTNEMYPWPLFILFLRSLSLFYGGEQGNLACFSNLERRLLEENRIIMPVSLAIQQILYMNIDFSWKEIKKHDVYIVGFFFVCGSLWRF